MSRFAGILIQHIIANPDFRSCSYVYINHYYLVPFVYGSYIHSRKINNPYAVSYTAQV